jgi:hypothetical protein
MKHTTTLAIAAVLFSTAAEAECYTRSTTVNTLNVQIERAVDFEKEVIPRGKDQIMCRITFRAMINGQWYPAQGEQTGSINDSLDGICAAAEKIGSSRILQEMGGSNVTVDQDMVCTDKPAQKVRPVKVGEMIQETEVAPHPTRRQSFSYMGTECRWFIETMPVGNGGMVQNQGVICRIRGNEWLVRDKWVQVVDK